MTDRDVALRRLASERLRLATALTVGMIVMYFGFVTLVAYDKPLMAHLVTDGLSVGILLGALVIVVSWILTLVYVRWANGHHDSELARLRGHAETGPR